MVLLCAAFFIVLRLQLGYAGDFDIGLALSTRTTDLLPDGSICPDPPELEHGTIETEITLSGNVEVFDCHSSYRRVGPMRVACQKGRWPNITRCLAKTCSADDILTTTNNDHRMVKPRAFGSVLSFTCDEGYTLKGDSLIYCWGDEDNPKWEGEPGYCVQEEKDQEETTTLVPEGHMPDQDIEKEGNKMNGPNADDEASQIQEEGSGEENMNFTSPAISENEFTKPKKRWSSFLIFLVVVFVGVCISVIIFGALHFIRRRGRAKDDYNVIHE